MKLPISDRLLACAGRVPKGSCVADVGCDHGYLGIYLLSNGIASRVIASDVREQPLLSAVRNAGKYGVKDKMSFFLSDGVRNIPRDFDVLVCAGMGADTMVSILEAAPWLRSEGYTMILQCQSKTPMLREYLSANGWHIAAETVLRDGRFLYTVMEVRWQPDAPKLSPAETYFPPVMLRVPVPETAEYFHWVTNGLQLAADRQNDLEKQKILAGLIALADQHPWLKEETP